MKERLQKLIAAAGLASRRQAERWIDAGRVTVNGRPASLGDQADSDRDRIEVDGRPLRLEQLKTYVLLHKPAGYVTTACDPQGRKVVTDLLADVKVRVFAVGRLDLNTEGLLLLTNDGDLAARLTHPRHQIAKTYLVRVRGALSAAARLSLEQGVKLDDGLTAPARVAKVRSSGSHTWLELTITEGRNRQVRRMCEAVGHPVSRLKRIGLAFLNLDGTPLGKYRQLTPAEVKRLKRL
ncbi:MAG: pseudouridine synthase [Syntrophotaleaceae bacterium]